MGGLADREADMLQATCERPGNAAPACTWLAEGGEGGLAGAGGLGGREAEAKPMPPHMTLFRDTQSGAR